MNDIIQPQQLTRKDFATDQDVRWCPGCGDYAILATVQRLMPELGITRENMVWVSGIGCSSRFPYYMNTYGFHTIHGRAPAFVTGIRATNPALQLWMVTGDGDGLSIGGNHLLHLLRRNVDTRVLMFNNRIYGLTKGQYSPTSEQGKVTKSTPDGSADQPVEPCSFAFGANASFISRSIDVEGAHLGEVLKRAAQHRGSAFVEIFQNCNVFNDGAFDAFRDHPELQLRLEHGKAMRFGKDGEKGLRFDVKRFALEVVTVGEDGVSEADLLVHDETNAVLGTLLSRMPFPEFPVALGVIYALPRPTWEDAIAGQRERAGSAGRPELERLLRSGHTWNVG